MHYITPEHLELHIELVHYHVCSYTIAWLSCFRCYVIYQRTSMAGVSHQPPMTFSPARLGRVESWVCIHSCHSLQQTSNAEKFPGLSIVGPQTPTVVFPIHASSSIPINHPL